MTASLDQSRRIARGRVTALASLALVASVLGLAYVGERWGLAVYALSFWHYYLYALAYCLGAVELANFKRDAVLMKSIALLMLGSVYLSAPLDPASLLVMAGGFLLNLSGALALGSDRTYYGYEVANLPPQRISAFPYSWVSHPMLLGNMAAYGGTLVNAEFRARWWPLACMHVALNLGLLLMEQYVAPQRRALRGGSVPAGRADFTSALLLGGCISAVGALLGAACYTDGGGHALTLVGAGSAAYAYVLFLCYS